MCIEQNAVFPIAVAVYDFVNLALMYNANRRLIYYKKRKKI